MIKKVFKYNVMVADSFHLEIPIGAEILTVQVQRGVPQIWALVDPSLQNEVRTFRLSGTGHPVDVSDYRDDLKYIGTFQIDSGYLVFHLFERLP